MRFAVQPDRYGQRNYEKVRKRICRFRVTRGRSMPGSLSRREFLASWLNSHWSPIAPRCNASR